MTVQVPLKAADVPMKPFVHKNSYEWHELLAFGNRECDAPALPLPPMLMFNRIANIDSNAGYYGRGIVRAELDLRPELWIFGCHFKGDPVVPGCLGADQLLQLTGFFMGWEGARGLGRARGIDGPLEFIAEILPTVRLVSYFVDIISCRVSPKVSVVRADGSIYADGALVTRAKGLRVLVLPHQEN